MFYTRTHARARVCVLKRGQEKTNTKKVEGNAVIDKEKTDNETMRVTTVMYS